jgi:hypothetical protein
MTAAQILAEIEPQGSEGYVRILRKHGVTGPLWGVKIEVLKKYQKVIKKDYQLSKDLFDSGIYDAMYLAGLIADEREMSEADLRDWLTKSTCHAIAEYSVAWVAADGPYGWNLGLDWIESSDDKVAVAGWGTLSSVVAVKADQELDVNTLRTLLHRVKSTIHQAPDRVRYKMNGFVISVGSYVSELSAEAIEIGEQIGTVTVDMGDTACKVPFAPDYIRKISEMGRVGKKRKTARC